MGNKDEVKKAIESGKTALGLEFGSTRIKAVLVDEAHNPIASGDHEWENRLENGFWTYSPEDVWSGLKDSYRKLVCDVREKYEADLTSIGAIGFSAMMHGYMAFDKDGKLLVPFRNWRNSTTGQAAEALTELFREFAENFGLDADMNKLFGMLYNKALEGDADCGGLLSYGYLSGENITNVTEGRPMFVCSPKSKFIVWTGIFRTATVI